MNNYAELRAALDQAEKGWGVTDGGLMSFFDISTVRALLAERDALRALLSELVACEDIKRRIAIQ